MSRCGHNIWDKLWLRINFGLGCLCTDTHTKALYLFMHRYTYKSTLSVYAQTHLQKHYLSTDTTECEHLGSNNELIKMHYDNGWPEELPPTQKLYRD